MTDDPRFYGVKETTPKRRRILASRRWFDRGDERLARNLLKCMLAVALVGIGFFLRGQI